MRKAYEHCEQLVHEADKDRFLASLFAPADRRAALHALYAFDIETARIRTLAHQPLPGELRLQWWRDVLNGERAEEASANPVAAALLDAVAAQGLRRGPLLELIDARAFDLYDAPMQTSEELESYCKRTSLSSILGRHESENRFCLCRPMVRFEGVRSLKNVLRERVNQPVPAVADLVGLELS